MVLLVSRDSVLLSTTIYRDSGTIESSQNKPYWLEVLTQLVNYLLKVSEDQNDFMKTSFLPKTIEIIVRISTNYIIGQKFWQ